jgi:hypothetical protein
MADGGVFGKGCPHCGSRGARHLGDCHVCSRSVCDQCGSVQISSGERTVVHRECLKHADGPFKMIKFVR